MGAAFHLPQRVNAYQPRVQPWGWDGGDGTGTGMVGMGPGHGRWGWNRDRDGGYRDARGFGGWGGASHECQGVALGCHMLPRWGRNRSRASPPNPGQPVHNLHVSTLTQRLQAR